MARPEKQVHLVFVDQALEVLDNLLRFTEVVVPLQLHFAAKYPPGGVDVSGPELIRIGVLRELGLRVSSCLGQTRTNHYLGHDSS